MSMCACVFRLYKKFWLSVAFRHVRFRQGTKCEVLCSSSPTEIRRVLLVEFRVQGFREHGVIGGEIRNQTTPQGTQGGRTKIMHSWFSAAGFLK